MKNYVSFIEFYEAIKLEKPVLKGTRITVETILRKCGQ